MKIKVVLFSGVFAPFEKNVSLRCFLCRILINVTLWWLENFPLRCLPTFVQFHNWLVRGSNLSLVGHLVSEQDLQAVSPSIHFANALDRFGYCARRHYQRIFGNINKGGERFWSLV